MADFSFLAAHLVALLYIVFRRHGVETVELLIALSILGPSTVVHLAAALPRLAGVAGLRQVGIQQALVAWGAAFLFVAGTHGWVHQTLERNPQWLISNSLLAAGLGLGEAVYGVFALWFFQSRARFNERLATALRAQLKGQDFDVFLCHNSADKPEVKKVAVLLMKQGIKPWLDEWDLRAGLPWRIALEERLREIGAAAVFVGRSGTGPWQSEELSVALDQSLRRNIPVIPVLLSDAPEGVKLPPFLAQRTWVDFRTNEALALERLVHGITGRTMTPAAAPTPAD